MQAQLHSIPSGTALSRTYCNEACSWTEKAFDTKISDEEKLLVLHYTIFSGIEVTYNYFLAHSFTHQHAHMPTIMELNHCRHGRIGWHMEHDLNLYLGEGDLSLHMKDHCANSYLSFPLGYYEGISFSIDFQDLLKHPPDILKEANVNYEQLKAAFCDTTKITALPNTSYVNSIFHSLYDLPEHLVIPYCKLKTQEFILFLSQLSLKEASLPTPCNSEQVKIVNDIHTLLTNNLNQRYTIEELSKKYLMNTSTLKSTFKAVYGMPIASYMKQYRMNQA
ncbi:MAG: AraC family transcriptional regulator, partial [bacterium]|nr:AraC family transcriptional regulator [bacterium]